MMDDKSKTVLIVDEDLGFVFWLGQLLTRTGHSAIPARNASDATYLLNQLAKTPDVLIVDAELPTAGALIQDLRGVNSSLSVVALQVKTEVPIHIWEIVDHWELRPSSWDTHTALRWLDVISSVSGQNRRYRGSGAN